MPQQPCTPRPRPPTFNRARSSTRRTTAERRVASQVDDSTSLAGLLAEDPPPPSGPPTAVSKVGSKSRTVSAPAHGIGSCPSLDERVAAAGRLSLSTSSSAGSTVASPPPPPYPSIRYHHSLAEDAAGDDAKDLHAIDLDALQSEVQTSAPVTEEWVKARSREELDLLLLEADRVIREREKELGVAAAIGKSLLENNIALRKRHETLLQAVPESTPELEEAGRPRLGRSVPQQRSSWVTDDDSSEDVLVGSRRDLVTPTVPAFPLDVQQASSGRRGASDDSPLPSAFTSPVKAKRAGLLALKSLESPTSLSKGHRRRSPSLTASPAALAFLRDQNHELATQLEQLQAETSQADHSGRKQLRRLEKEIGGLRSELEKMETMVESLQEKNGELEVQFVRAISPGVVRHPRDGVWSERRKERREEPWEMKVEDLEGPRAKRFVFPRMPATHEVHSDHDAASPDDLFAPSASSRDGGHLARSASSTSSASPPPSPRTRSLSLLGPALSESRSASMRHSASPSNQRSNAEMEVVAQLLAKIRELEQANIEIRCKRDELDSKLSRAIQDGAELEGVYNALEHEVERAGLDFESDDELPAQYRPDVGRLSSRSPDSASQEADFFAPSPLGLRDSSQKAKASVRTPSVSPIRERSPLAQKVTCLGTAFDSPTPSTSSTYSRAAGNRHMIAVQRAAEQQLPTPAKRPLMAGGRHTRNRSSFSVKVGSPARIVASVVQPASASSSVVHSPVARSLEDEMKALDRAAMSSPERLRSIGRQGRTPKRSSLHLSFAQSPVDVDPSEESEAHADVEASDSNAVRDSNLPARRASGRQVALRPKRRTALKAKTDGHLSIRRAPGGLSLHVMPPIIPAGSLSTTPPADCPSFDSLDSAVADRPMRWAEDELFGRGSLIQHAPPVPRSIWSYFPSLLPRQRGDPFEIDIYRETVLINDEQNAIARLHFREARIRAAIEAGKDPWTEDNLRPPTRRELALIRLSLEAGTDGRGSSSDDDDFQLIDGERGGRGGRRLLSAPTDGPLLWSERMKPGWVVDRVSKSWLRSALEVVFFVQVLVVGLLFFSEVFRTTKKKRVKTIERGSSRH